MRIAPEFMRLTLHYRFHKQEITFFGLLCDTLNTSNFTHIKSATTNKVDFMLYQIE